MFVNFTKKSLTFYFSYFEHGSLSIINKMITEESYMKKTLSNSAEKEICILACRKAKDFLGVLLAAYTLRGQTEKKISEMIFHDHMKRTDGKNHVGLHRKT